LGFKLLLQKKKIFLKKFCERLSRSSVEALGCKLLHQKQNLSENCLLQRIVVVTRTWCRSGTISFAASDLQGNRSGETGRADATDIGFDVAIRRHGVLKRKRDVESRRRIESYVAEADERRNRQLL
jgi:hypothetical protein